jgi:dUTP pyrophosphatase
MSYIKFKKLHPDAIIPTRANQYDAGLDIYALEDIVIAGSHMSLDLKGANGMTWETVFRTRSSVIVGQAPIPTGIAVEVPQGFYGKFSSRSGLAFKHGVFCLDGTVDAGYRGEIRGLLFNTTDKPYTIKKGDRIAQLVILPVALLEPVEATELSNGTRGGRGFGSTGV